MPILGSVLHCLRVFMRTEVSQTQCEYFWNGAVFVSLCNEVQQQSSWDLVSTIASGAIIGGLAYVAFNTRRQVQIKALWDSTARRVETLYRKIVESKAPLDPVISQGIIRDYFSRDFQNLSAFEQLLMRGLLPAEVKLVHDFHQIFSGKIEGSPQVQLEVAKAILEIKKVKEENLFQSSKRWDLEAIEKMMATLGLDNPFLVLKEAYPENSTLLGLGPWNLLVRALQIVGEKRADIDLSAYKRANWEMISEIRDLIPKEKRDLMELVLYAALESKETSQEYEIIGFQEDIPLELERIAHERGKLDILLKMYRDIDTPLSRIEELESTSFLRSLVEQMKDPSRGQQIFKSMGMGQIISTSLTEDPDLFTSEKTLIELIQEMKDKGAQVCGW